MNAERRHTEDAMKFDTERKFGVEIEIATGDVRRIAAKLNERGVRCYVEHYNHDVRGYWAEYKLSAKGNPFQTMVKAFAGRDPADDKAAECLKKAIEATQLRCPRDGKVTEVKTAICL